MQPALSKLTVGITTRNRFNSLVRCVRSLNIISDFVHEIIIVDDCSDHPVEEPLREEIGENFRLPIKVIRHDQNHGPIVARNTIAETAAAKLILSLDDDAVIIEPKGVKRAVEILQKDESVAAVAFAQAEADGNPWPESMQPSPMKYPCYVAAFIGFATILRKDIFLSLGGYRSLFHYYGEEKEYCIRLLDSGHHVVYLPDALVRHLPDPSGRSQRKYIRHAIRNDCLGAIYNEPLPVMILSIAFRMYAYLRMTNQSQTRDTGGFRWIMKEIFSSLPEVWRERRPVRWATFMEWRRIKKSWPHYQTRDNAL